MTAAAGIGGTATLVLNDHNISGNATGVSATSQIALKTDGTLVGYDDSNGSTVFPAEWVIGGYQGIGVLYDVKASVVSGTVSGSTVDSWVNAGTERVWSTTRSVNGTNQCTFSLKIGYAGSDTVIAQSSVVLEATYVP